MRDQSQHPGIAAPDIRGHGVSVEVAGAYPFQVFALVADYKVDLIRATSHQYVMVQVVRLNLYAIFELERDSVNIRADDAGGMNGESCLFQNFAACRSQNIQIPFFHMAAWQQPCSLD